MGYNMVKVIFLLIFLLFTIECKKQKPLRDKIYQEDYDNRSFSNNNTDHPSREECDRRIYYQCNHRRVFTDEDLETVRQFLNYSFTELADIKPDKPLCSKIHVRQNWKCLTPNKRKRFVYAVKELYRNGVIHNLTDLHERFWPAWHKSAEIYPAHRWFFNEFEKYLREIDPELTLPYWDIWSIATQPEKSSLWDIFGTSGEYEDGYVVPDGIYPEMNLLPTVRRHWSPGDRIYPWVTHEFNAQIIQAAADYSTMSAIGQGQHFMPHANIGGYEGQYTVASAPYDVIFFLHHLAFIDVLLFRWQMSDPTLYTPLSYDANFWVYNQTTGEIEQPSIAEDDLTGAPGVTIRELFWMGFGDLCYIPDQLIDPIVRLANGKPDPIPTAVKRMPKQIIEKYFPSFLENNYSGLLHTFEEVGNCNRECLPLPKPTFLNETAAGRKLLDSFKEETGHDTTHLLEMSERIVFNLWSDLRKYRYCSPYVTSY